jgi:hypothetical protein
MEYKFNGTSPNTTVTLHRWQPVSALSNIDNKIRNNRSYRIKPENQER